MIRPAAVHLTLPAERPPWTPTGVRVRRGDRVTLLGSGRIRWSSGRDGGARYHLRGRVQGGETFGCPADTATVVADRTGELELCVYLGERAEQAGAPASPSAGRGALEVTVLRWPPGVDPVRGLAALPASVADPGLAAAERARLLDPVVPPPGWVYDPLLGPGEMFRHAVADGKPAVTVECHDAAGIIALDKSFPLTRETRLDWSWRVDELPADGPEDRPGGHDHLGIGLRFGTGRDLSWFWSAGLAPEDGAFTCPVRGGREVHVPIRRGPLGLGRWRRESRDLWTDHARFLGPPPGRVAQVRLLAVSHFGGGSGRATVSDVVLRAGGRRLRVL